MVELIERRIDTFFKIFEWIVVLGLWITSMYLVKDVWVKYTSYDTNFKVSREKPTIGPTIMVCNMASNRTFENDKNFTLFYSTFGANFEQKKKKIKEGSNDVTMGNLVHYETMSTPWENCHKISIRNISDASWIGIKINFNESFLESSQLKVQIMDDENSYGWLYAKFLGKILSYSVEFRKYLWLKLKPEKFKYLDKSQSPKSKCVDGSYYDCMELELLDQVESNCSKKCSPILTKNISIWRCEDEEIQNCAERIFTENVIYGGSISSNCKKPCEIKQYIEDWKAWADGSGEVLFPNNNPNEESKLWFWLWYQFEDDQDVIVYEEYLIYDTVNMIGSLGGTLGIFIGFSFSNVLNVIISLIKSCLIAIYNYKNPSQL